MGKSKPAAPAPVIVQAQPTATQQATFNKDAALSQRALNTVDQYTPEGSLTYHETGDTIAGIPQIAAVQNLSPEQQQLHDIGVDLSTQYGQIGQNQLGQVSGSLSQPFNVNDVVGAPQAAPDFSNLPAAPTAPVQVNEATRNASRDAMLARMAPQMATDRSALEAQLANQGFQVGTEAYDTAMDERNRAMNDLYLGADIQSGQEMERMFGINSQQFGQQGQLRQQALSEMAQQYGLAGNVRDRAINEALMNRNQPLSELNTLMSGSQPSAPSFVPTPQGNINAPDFMGAAYGSANQQNTANQNAYNQNMAAYNANLQGLYGLGGAAFKWGGG